MDGELPDDRGLPRDLNGHRHIFELRRNVLNEDLDEVRLTREVVREVLVLAHAAEGN